MVPSRGFKTAEFERRLDSFQHHMRHAEVDGVLLTQEPEVRYFSGFFSQFWESPTRPWFLVLPAAGKPIAVIPEIGRSGMDATWVDDIYSWPAPRPEDDGISLLTDVIGGLPRRFGRLGMALGPDSFIRQPIRDFRRLLDAIAPLEVIDIADQLHAQRFVKSDAELAKLRYICGLASDGFGALPAVMAAGQTEREICREFRQSLLSIGADSTSYMVAGSGPGGYDSIIMGPTDRRLQSGDLMIIDTGTHWDGYFCDFDRNFSFGTPEDAVRRSYDTVFRATDAGLAAARPGATVGDVYDAMAQVLAAGGALGNSVGRLGHGLGMQLTEWPSVVGGSPVELVPGSVLTLEPGMEFAPGKQMVHEEDIVITENGAELLSRRAAPEVIVI